MLHYVSLLGVVTLLLVGATVLHPGHGNPSEAPALVRLQTEPPKPSCAGTAKAATRLRGRPEPVGEQAVGARTISSPLRAPPVEETTEQRAAEVEGLLEALRAFAQRGPSTAMAVEDVICCVDSYSYLRFPTDARREMQVLASDALFSLGRDAVQPVIDAVLRSPATRLRWGGAPFITGNEPDTREWLDLESGAYVLKRIGAPAVVPLAALLGDERTCAWAARTLCYLSRDVDIGPALHAVRANLRADAPLDVVLTSLWLVGFFSDDDVAFLLRDITPLVWAGRPRLQEATVQTLAGLGAKAAPAQFVLESLHRSLSAEEGAIRAEVERAMVAIGARG